MSIDKFIRFQQLEELYDAAALAEKGKNRFKRMSVCACACVCECECECECECAWSELFPKKTHLRFILTVLCVFLCIADHVPKRQ